VLDQRERRKEHGREDRQDRDRKGGAAAARGDETRTFGQLRQPRDRVGVRALAPADSLSHLDE
jgi:hypothetical protein